jgi:hypothetical protein
LVALLDNFIDEVGEDDNSPFASMMEIIGVFIVDYENIHAPELN